MTIMVPEQPADLRSVLERAQEIESETGLLLRQNPEWSDMIQAAQEAGVPREAILEALRERIGVAAAPDFAKEELVFATTGGGWFNPARIESVKGGQVRVRFLGGGDAEVDIRDVKRFSLVPGDVVHISYWGSWTKVEVLSFNRDSLSVTINIWGTNETRSVEGLRLKDPRTQKPLKDQVMMWAYAGVSFLAGAGVCAVLMRILSR
jgi:hypothetical protein